MVFRQTIIYMYTFGRPFIWIMYSQCIQPIHVHRLGVYLSSPYTYLSKLLISNLQKHNELFRSFLQIYMHFVVLETGALAFEIVYHSYKFVDAFWSILIHSCIHITVKSYRNTMELYWHTIFHYCHWILSKNTGPF